MKTLQDSINKLDELEPEMMTLEMLSALGCVIPNQNGFQVGDFDFFTWNHCLNGFSVGVITRERQDGNPFPALTQPQKKWVICCKGSLKIGYQDSSHILNEGYRVTIPPKIKHDIQPMTPEAVAIIVVIPEDPGMGPRSHE